MTVGTNRGDSLVSRSGPFSASPLLVRITVPACNRRADGKLDDLDERRIRDDRRMPVHECGGDLEGLVLSLGAHVRRASPPSQARTSYITSYIGGLVFFFNAFLRRDSGRQPSIRDRSGTAGSLDIRNPLQ